MGTRQHTRYELRDCSQVTVVLAPEDSTEEVAAELLDISRGGAKLALADEARIGGTVTVHFHELDLALAARVCWCRQESRRRWWAACMFEPLLDDALHKLLDEGYLERRHQEREAIELTTLAKWGLGEARTIAIRDFSAGGICVSSPRGAQRDQRLLLEIEQPDEVQATVLVQVQWQIEFEDSYLIGCSFVNPQGLVTIRRFVSMQKVGAAEASGQLGRFRFGRLLSLLKNIRAGRTEDATPTA